VLDKTGSLPASFPVQIIYHIISLTPGFCPARYAADSTLRPRVILSAANIQLYAYCYRIYSGNLLFEYSAQLSVVRRLFSGIAADAILQAYTASCQSSRRVGRLLACGDAWGRVEVSVICRHFVTELWTKQEVDSQQHHTTRSTESSPPQA